MDWYGPCRVESNLPGCRVSRSGSVSSLVSTLKHSSALYTSPVSMNGYKHVHIHIHMNIPSTTILHIAREHVFQRIIYHRLLLVPYHTILYHNYSTDHSTLYSQQSIHHPQRHTSRLTIEPRDLDFTCSLLRSITGHRVLLYYHGTLVVLV